MPRGATAPCAAIQQFGDLSGDGRRDALGWRLSQTTRLANTGHWHAHEGRHTVVSIMNSHGVPIQEISDTVGRKASHVNETVCRHVIVPAIRGGATIRVTSSEPPPGRRHL